MGISMSKPQVGASFSSPQLGDGPVLVSDPDAIGPFTSAFTVDPSDTNYLGFSASMSSMGTIVQAQYTDTANVVRTATCSAQISSYSTYTDVSYDFEDGFPTPTTVTGINSYGSILCPIANTQIGTGPLVLSLTGDGDESQSFGPSTYALYVGRTTATVSPEPSTTTSVVPGQTTYLATVTSTVYGFTETVGVITTLTGQYNASRCAALQISSPTTLSTSTRNSSSSVSSSELSSSRQSSNASSSALSSSSSALSLSTSSSSSRRASSTATSSPQTSPQTHSTSALASRSLSSNSSPKSSSPSPLVLGSNSIKVSSSKTTLSSRVSSRSTSPTSSTLSRTASSPKTVSTAKTSSSPKTSTLPKTTSSSKSKTSSTLSKSSSSKISASSRTTSKSASSKAASKTSSTKISSKSTSSTPVCSTGTALKSLSSYPSIASHLCQDILRTKQTFPSSISVWPVSQLSSACSCYGKSSPTKISASAKPSLSKRFPVVERPFVSSGTNATFSNSSSVSSSSTTLVPATVLGYGPPTIYSVPTVTITTSLSTDTVYVTGDHAILPTTTIMVSLGTTTVTTNSTVTIDQRTLPTTCISDFNSTTVTLSARSLTCTNLKLHTAFLWVMMEDPFDFCAYYLTANRNTSPLLEMSASTLKDTCSCLVTYKSAPLPVFKVGSSYSPKPKRQCNRSVASLIQAKFKEPKTFCKYYTSTSRNISPFSILKPGDVFAGCSCLI